MEMYTLKSWADALVQYPFFSEICVRQSHSHQNRTCNCYPFLHVIAQCLTTFHRNKQEKVGNHVSGVSALIGPPWVNWIPVHLALKILQNLCDLLWSFVFPNQNGQPTNHVCWQSVPMILYGRVYPLQSTRWHLEQDWFYVGLCSSFVKSSWRKFWRIIWHDLDTHRKPRETQDTNNMDESLRWGRNRRVRPRFLFLFCVHTKKCNLKSVSEELRIVNSNVSCFSESGESDSMELRRKAPHMKIEAQIWHITSGKKIMKIWHLSRARL